MNKVSIMCSQPIDYKAYTVTKSLKKSLER